MKPKDWTGMLPGDLFKSYGTTYYIQDLSGVENNFKYGKESMEHYDECATGIVIGVLFGQRDDALSKLRSTWYLAMMSNVGLAYIRHSDMNCVRLSNFEFRRVIVKEQQ